MTSKLLTGVAVEQALYCCGPAGIQQLTEFLRRFDYDVDGERLMRHIAGLMQQGKAVDGKVSLPGHPGQVHLFALNGQWSN